MLDKNKIGLVLGLFFAVVHAIWSLLIAVIPGSLQSYLSWMFTLHSLKPIYYLLPFNSANAILLVIMTFVIGYIFGWVFAWAYNLIHKERRRRR